ncbi:hypothetical protein OXX79_001294 [Metschnikowia pulcherrima]
MVMTGLLHRTVGIHKAIQWSFEAWNMMPKHIVHMCWWKSGFSSPPVVSDSETSPYNLPVASDECEININLDDKPPDDEALELVKNYVGDKEVNEFICRQSLQPH